MKYTQRDRAPEPTEAMVWTPAPLDSAGEPIPVEVPEGAWYVTVDEVIEEHVRLVAAPWPRIDAYQRLVFPEEDQRLPGRFRLAKLQAFLDKRRIVHGQPVRPVRIGDTFLVRGEVGRLSGWRDVVDVTGPARELAKRALLRAIAWPTDRRLEAAAQFIEDPPPPTERRRPAPTPRLRQPGSVANPAV